MKGSKQEAHTDRLVFDVRVSSEAGQPCLINYANIYIYQGEENVQEIVLQFTSCPHAG